MTMKKHDEHCKAIAEELTKIIYGEYVVIDGTLTELKTDDYGIPYAETYGEYYTENGVEISLGGEEIETYEEELYSATLGDYFDEFYNIEFVCDADKELTACRIMIACGGPNIYVNTWDKCVELFWWNESGKAWLPHEVCESINEFVSECYWNN